MAWTKLFNTPINLEVQTKVLPMKGNIVYEYNPFRNYRLSKNMYEYRNSIYSLEDLEKRFGITMNGTTSWNNLPDDEQPILREKGELVDFISDELNFSLDHPVHIVPQYSYDGSVNLIINDGINVPRLINSRFSATGRNTYEIVDRKGNNDTNIYDQGEQFDIDTSLYKRVIKIPKIDFKGVSAGGNLRVGNYHFYFKLSDADGNETDFVGESGLVSVFIGFNDYFSVTTGTKNENSFKQVNFQISNIDSSYDYVTVYFSRSTAEGGMNPVTTYTKIDKKYSVNNASIANVIITGFENMVDISATDINLNYNIVDSVGTSAVCQNMLFLGNVHKPDIPYNELQDLSLRFLPYLKQEEYAVDVDQNYSISTANKGYLDPKFIYNKTGYWGGEIYRFGIVYILNNGELSPVFNVRGSYNIREFTSDTSYKYIDSQYTRIPIWENNQRNYINYHEEKYTLLGDNVVSSYENVKGVVTFKPSKDTNTIYSVDFRVDDDTIQELKKLVRGYFFVRQTRIPTILAQGITIGIDKESHTPTIPTADGFLTDLSESLSKTHVTTEDINDVNYISEGFLSRYSFRFQVKSSSLWGKIGKIAAIGVGAIALAAATVASGGLAGVAAGAISGFASIGVTAGSVAAVASAAGAVVTGALTSTLVVGTAIAAGAAVVGTAVAGAIQETRYGIGHYTQKWFKKKKLDGRNTKAPAGHKIVETDDSRKLSQDFLDRFIPKDPSCNTVSGIICPDYALNQPYYNQIFTGNTHLIQLTQSQNINYLNGHSSNYFTNDNRHFYVPSYTDRDVYTSHYFKVIGVSDNVKCVGVDEMLFRSRAGEAEEAFRYECIAEDYKSDKSKATGSEDTETVNNKKINTDIIRGSFGPYLAFNDKGSRFQPAETVNIYIPEYSTANMEEYFYLRMVDNSMFYAITDRFDFQDIDDKLIVSPTNIANNEPDRTCGYQINAYRGDCYLCQYTHRVVRNFNDPSAPYNDDIVDENTWKDNYDPDNPEKYSEINLGDINAIQIGMWVTFKLRSSNNLNIRTLDGSYVDETVMQGHPRGYYPYHPMSAEGSYKHPESQIYNRGFAKSVSDRWNIELPDVPHIKNFFKTRIMYSDIHINDAYKNGFRVFRGQNYRDYTREYGEIVKLVSFESSLLCVFEHGVALIPVNERAVAGQGAGGNVYINTSNVLPENPKIISDMFGSQWPESILKVPGKTGNSPQYVYGVDTVAKKIWRTDGQTLECISDFKVQEFLNNNITLGERELTPKIGIRNVKTHYNAFKRDVMFTFYDNTYGFEEKVWNLCWNELLNTFVTFYSWVPSYMENINNIPFSFNRDTSKWIAKLGTSHCDNSFADGITLTSVIMDEPIYTIDIPYVTNKGKLSTFRYAFEGNTNKLIGLLGLSNRVLPIDSVFCNISYELVRDNYGNYKNFDVLPIDGAPLPNDAKFFGKSVPVYGLYYKGNIEEFYSELYYRNRKGHSYSDDIANSYNYIKYDEYNNPVSLDKKALGLPIFKDSTGKRINLSRKQMLNPDKIVRLLNIKAKIDLVYDDLPDELSSDFHNLKAGFESGTTLMDAGYYESVVAVTPKWNLQFLSTDFWKHGQAGIIDIADEIFPTQWYGRQHPFEFEVVVVNDPSVHKIFDNLEIVANKAKPESFHYEIVGECYDFAKDKPNMYFRQEAKKALWQYNGADICYNRDFIKVQTKQQPKSADFPHKYYYRQDKINEIEDYYYGWAVEGNPSKKYSPAPPDYKHLAGAEIVYYPNRQEFRICNHVLAVDRDDLLDNTLCWDKAKGITIYWKDELGREHKNHGRDYYSGGRSIIGANCEYLEDKWKVSINPIIICYKNEYKNKLELFGEDNSTWHSNRPTITIHNSQPPKGVPSTIQIPEADDNTILNQVYDYKHNTSIDDNDWLNIEVSKFGEEHNRKETDVRGNFMKVRIRYSGEELAIINFLNTIYRVSYA